MCFAPNNSRSAYSDPPTAYCLPPTCTSVKVPSKCLSQKLRFSEKYAHRVRHPKILYSVHLSRPHKLPPLRTPQPAAYCLPPTAYLRFMPLTLQPRHQLSPWLDPMLSAPRSTFARRLPVLASSRFRLRAHPAESWRKVNGPKTTFLSRVPHTNFPLEQTRFAQRKKPVSSDSLQ